MLTFALAIALAQTPQHRLFLQPNLPTSSYAFFEGAPMSGAGMSAPCACANVTGAKGEALTWARASNGTCSKRGLANTSIGIGDLVVCASNLPRVEPSAGTVGIRTEVARTNSLTRSEALTNAIWLYEASGTAITSTADYTNDPGNTSGAERLQIPATSGVGYADFYQTFTASVATAPAVCSIFATGTSASGTTDLCGYDGAAWSCTACTTAAYPNFTRCVHRMATGSTTTTRYCKFGNNSLQNGGVARSAVDVVAWGFQGEEGSRPSSYIPTTNIAVTRAEEGGSLAVVLPNGAGCLAATFETWDDSLNNGRLLLAWLDASNVFDMYIGSTSPAVTVQVGGVGETTYTTAATFPGGPFRVIATRVPSTSRSVQLIGNAPTSAASALGVFTPTTLFVGRYGSTITSFHPNGIISRMQADPAASRCTP